MALELDTRARYYAGAECPASATSTKAPAKDEEELDLFADDDQGEAEDLQKVMAARREASKKEEAAKKKEKKPVIAKSSVTLHAMPYDAEKDITGLYESDIKKIEIEGLVWGVPFSVVNGPFGLKGLQFGCVVEDEKVKTDDIEEAIETIGMKPEDAKKYIEMRHDGSLDDHDEEWEGKLIGTVKVVSFQKI
eukprot:Gregarina_sp_Pseudo_9__2823@NODE_3056_length_770_cov_89_861833_g2787_i0_p1_GENE_NODE_3056_length_770_cov_89_861833_g2787_i0NODE_3056_length_770_cov_89_861833_g2787_i0_p1_ORF_typecomplete_len203_score68_22EF1_GNE/PF00736_19/6_3e03EF1_GNE/PF00736_19/7_2e18Rtf2/PF04641_12/10_NODE_3056_length_770_cov_89_861833_g2787_i036611